MSWPRLLFVCVLVTAIPCLAQDSAPSAPQPQPTAGEPSSTNDQTSSTQQNSETQTDKNPSRIKRALDRAKPDCVNVGGAGTCWDNGHNQQNTQKPATSEQSQFPGNQPPPREGPPPGESSSRQTQIDISPPPDDVTHEGADTSDVTEMHSYDPHRAAKNVEVGDFYYHKKDYRAAESRYQSALEWKPNDALATFRLAQAQEKLGEKADALQNYRQYLKILPDGDFAKDAKEAIARLNK